MLLVQLTRHIRKAAHHKEAECHDGDAEVTTFEHLAQLLAVVTIPTDDHRAEHSTRGQGGCR